MSASFEPLSLRVKLALGLLLLIAAGVPLVYPLIQSKKSERVNTLRMPLLSIEETKTATTPGDGVLAVVCNRNADATLTRLRVVFGEASPEERPGRAVEGRLSEPMPPSSCREIPFSGPTLRNGGQPEAPTAWSALWDKDVPEQWEAFIPVKPKSP
jgi:hypothetical protein